MRLVRFRMGQKLRLGALVGDGLRIVALQVAAANYLRQRGDPLGLQEAEIRIPASTAEFLRGGDISTTLARDAFDYVLSASDEMQDRCFVSRGMARLEAPLDPSLIVCGGGNFWDHLEELGRDKPEQVEFFLKNPESVLGPEDDIPYQPWVSQKLDYEAELGIVIGRRGRCIPRDRALEHVFGYTAVNDMAVRDRQLFRWGDTACFHVKYGDGKVFDNNLVLGPALISADEVADPMNLNLRCWVDGEMRQNSNTKNYIWGVAEVIEYYSSMMTLEPGFLICPGTPGGCAVGSDPGCGGKSKVKTSGPEYLVPGQMVVIDVEGIGRLENRVRAASNSDMVGEFNRERLNASGCL
jgi:acylpyruvate hydrolase